LLLLLLSAAADVLLDCSGKHGHLQ
jgi:hypothetical protein